jgi:hypothetical protein
MVRSGCKRILLKALGLSKQRLHHLGVQILILTAYVGLAMLWMLPVMGQFNRALASSPGSYDWTTDIALLPMIAHAMSHLAFTFRTSLLNAPYGVNLAWTALNYTWSFIMSPVTDIWGVIAGYNSIFLCSLVADGIAMYWALRHWTKSSVAAFLGGMMFMFSPYVVGQGLMNHLDLMAVWTLPVIAVLTYDAMETQYHSPKVTGMLIGGLLFVQAFTSEEVAAITVLFGVGVALVWAWRNRSKTLVLKHAISSACWAIPLAFGGLGTVTCAQFLGGGVIHGAVVGSASYSVDLLDFFLPGSWQATAIPAISQWVQHFTFAPAEATAYIGVPLFGITIVMWKHGDRFDRVVVIIAAVAALLALGPKLLVAGDKSVIDFLPMAVIGKLPMLDNLLPDRITLVLDAALSVLLARFTSQYMHHCRRVLVYGALLLAVGSWMPLWPTAVTPPTPIYFRHPIHNTGIFLLLPFAQVGPTAISEYWQAVAGDQFAMTGGYFASRAVGAGAFTDGPRLSPLTLDFYSVTTSGRLWYPLPDTNDFNAYLRTHRVTIIVVGPEPHESMMLGVIERLTHVRPRRDQGVWVWRVPAAGFRATT